MLWNQAALTILDTKMAENEYPSREKVTKIAQEIHNSDPDRYDSYGFGDLERKVENWFKNERMRRRKGQRSALKKIENLQKNCVQKSASVLEKVVQKKSVGKNPVETNNVQTNTVQTVSIEKEHEIALLRITLQNTVLEKGMLEKQCLWLKLQLEESLKRGEFQRQEMQKIKKLPQGNL